MRWGGVEMVGGWACCSSGYEMVRA